MRLLPALVCPLVALPLGAVLWGFCVDDAWIVRRVALRGLAGSGFSFNSGQLSDAVTPLGFAQLMAGVSALFGADPLKTARVLGALAMGASGLVAALPLTGQVVPVGPSNQATVPAEPNQASRPPSQLLVLRLVVLCLLLGSCVPLAAWAGAGLETGLVTLLTTTGCVALCRGADLGGALLLGAASAWRPELLFFSLACSVLLPGATSPWKDTPLRRALAVLALPALVALVRLWVFGSPLPLAAVAKAPEPGLGLRYALGGGFWCGPVLVSWLGLFTRGRRVFLPLIAHALALVLAGGDWMPLFRLWVPVLPFAAYQAALAFSRRPRLWLVPVALAVLVNLPLLLSFGADARRVLARRLALIEATRPYLGNARVVAGVDVGWLGAATSADLLDLGGVTDPRIARLPGGHTSKQLSPGLFAQRDVDAWVVRDLESRYRVGGDLAELLAAYVVDARLLLRFEDLGLAPRATIPLPGTGGQYVVFGRPATTP